MIHWFPGHMNKALRELENYTKLADSIVYVLDARAPNSCVNEEFEKFISKKDTIYVLNKADLVSKETLLKWQEFFKKKGRDCICTNSTDSNGARSLKIALSKLHAELIAKYSEKGVSKVPRSIVIGIPNTGKSTLINNLAQKKKLVAENKPGVTRKIQWVRIPPNIDIMDSPGILYPDFSDQKKAYRLAVIGSIKDIIYDEIEVANFLIEEIRQFAPLTLLNRFPSAFSEDKNSFSLKDISKSRGFLLPGGILDENRAAISIINDYRKGLLGKICLDDFESSD